MTADRLDSWKEIAAFLRTSLRSVQRWEKTEGLPVHRHQHLKGGTVFAFPSEIEAWRVRRSDLFSARAGSRHRLLIVGVAVTVLMAAAVVFSRKWPEPASAPRMTPLTSYPGHEIFPAFSPDGSQVVFSWNGPQQNQYDLYLQEVGAHSPLRLTSDPDDDLSAAWSPDGRTIAFLRCPRGAVLNMVPQGNAGLYLFTLPAGPERRLSDIDAVPHTPHAYGAHVTWHPNGRWLIVTDRAVSREQPGLFLVSAASGEKRRLTRPPVRTGADIGPAFSRDARTLTFVRVDSFTVSEIYRLDLSNDHTPVAEPRQLTSGGRFNSCPGWGADGSIRFLSGHFRAQRQLLRMPAAGSTHPESAGLAPDDATFLAHSPQAGRLAYVRQVSDSNIWRVGDSAPFLSSTRWDGMAQFSPDGRRIAFVSDRSGAFEIWVARTDGSHPVQLTSLKGPYAGRPCWSPDGESIAFFARVKGNADIYVIRSAGGVLRRLTHHPSEDARPSWSRDGRWIYHTSQRDGANRIWKTPAAGGETVRVTSGYATTPVESHDGRFLYFVKSVRDGFPLWKVRLEGGDETQVLPSLADDTAFEVAKQGIYFIAGNSIRFRRASDGSITTLMKLAKPASRGLSVSPNAQTILYAQVDQQGADLALAENFR